MKKGQAQIITTVLIILLVIVAVIIVWNVVKPMIEESSENIGAGTSAFSVQLEIEEVKLWVTGGAQVTVKRNAGEGEIEGLRFVFEKDDGETEIIEKSIANGDIIPDELETKVYDFDVNEINEKIEKVSIAPDIGGSLGIEVKESDSQIRKDDDGNRIVEEEIPQEIIDDLDIVAWWKFNGDFEDSFGDNHGDNMGTDADANTDVLVLDGDDYVETGNNGPSSAEIAGNELTISAFVKPSIFSFCVEI